MRHQDPFAPAFCDRSTFGPNGSLAAYCFGGAHAPPQAPAMVAPPKPETPDNQTQIAATKKQGLQATLLTGSNNAGALGGSSTLLGSSTPAASSAIPMNQNAYGGQS